MQDDNVMIYVLLIRWNTRFRFFIYFILCCTHSRLASCVCFLACKLVEVGHVLIDQDNKFGWHRVMAGAVYVVALSFFITVNAW